MYVDSHAHYDDKRFDEDRDRLLLDLHENGIDFIVNSGATMKSSRFGIELSEKYDFIYTGVGVHPHDVKDLTEDDLVILEDYCSHPKTVAIGEIGLDFYYDNSPRELQIFWFKKQLQLAEKLNKSVIIHSRDAAKLCFDIIKESNVRKGVIHCYSGSSQMALDYIDLGFYIGVGGVVTFPNAKTLVEVVKDIPIEKILLETDCPYLSPEPNRRSRNDSHNLKYIADKIGQIKQLTTEYVADVTKSNAVSLFFSK